MLKIIERTGGGDPTSCPGTGLLLCRVEFGIQREGRPGQSAVRRQLA